MQHLGFYPPPAQRWGGSATPDVIRGSRGGGSCTRAKGPPPPTPPNHSRSPCPDGAKRRSGCSWGEGSCGAAFRVRLRARSLIALERVARTLALPRHRLPLAVLHLQGLQAKVADVMLVGERARRRDRAHAVILHALECRNQ